MLYRTRYFLKYQTLHNIDIDFFITYQDEVCVEFEPKGATFSIDFEEKIFS